MKKEDKISSIPLKLLLRLVPPNLLLRKSETTNLPFIPTSMRLIKCSLLKDGHRLMLTLEEVTNLNTQTLYRTSGLKRVANSGVLMKIKGPRQSCRIGPQHWRGFNNMILLFLL